MLSLFRVISRAKFVEYLSFSHSDTLSNELFDSYVRIFGPGLAYECRIDLEYAEFNDVFGPQIGEPFIFKLSSKTSPA